MTLDNFPPREEELVPAQHRDQIELSEHDDV